MIKNNSSGNLVTVMASNEVGLLSLVRLMTSYSNYKYVIVLDPNDPGRYNDRIKFYLQNSNSSYDIFSWREYLKSPVISEFGFLLWWSYILSEEIIALSTNGFFNLHPSLLPYNRGKHPYVHAILNSNPFGVTIHKINSKIDSGFIIAQKTIPYDWSDTGGTLYAKSKVSIIELFADTLPIIFDNSYIEMPIMNTKVNYSKDLLKLSYLNLDEKYLLRDILNLIRARTFNELGSIYFLDHGVKWSLTIKINKERI